MSFAQNPSFRNRVQAHFSYYDGDYMVTSFEPSDTHLRLITKNKEANQIWFLVSPYRSSK